MLKKHLWLAFGAAIMAVSPAAGVEPVKLDEGLKVGSAAPNIYGRKMDDSSFILSGEAAGPKVISFFWVKCLPCKKELPEMAAMEKKYPTVKFIAVHADAGYAKELPAFLREIGAAPSTIVVADKTVAASYAFTAFPHTVVIDANNKVRFVLSGYDEGNMARLEGFVAAEDAKQAEGLKAGNAAPNIFGRKTDDSPFTLFQAGDAPKVIYFFGVKCIACKKELPELAAMEKKYSGVKFIAVHADSDHTKELPAFMRESGTSPSTVVIADKTITGRYAFKGYPHIVVIDAKNRVLLAVGGNDGRNMARLESFIQRFK